MKTKLSTKKIIVFSIVAVFGLFLVFSILRTSSSSESSIQSGININDRDFSYSSEGVQSAPAFGEPDSFDSMISEDFVSSESMEPTRSEGNGPFGGTGSNKEITKRSIIQTGDIVMLDVDPEGTARQIRAIAESYGGFVSNSQTVKDINFGDYVEVKIEVRVPSDKFLDTVEQVSDLGDEIFRENINSVDVSLEIIDLTTRINIAEKSIERLSLLLLEAKDLNQIFYLEDELNRRQSDLDSTKSRLAYIQDQASYSTLTTTIQNEEVPTRIDPPTPEPKVEEPKGFVGGLQDGWEQTTKILNKVATDFGYFIPILFFLIIPVIIVVSVLYIIFFFVLNRIFRKKTEGNKTIVSSDDTLNIK
jgi:hypothetical protein